MVRSLRQRIALAVLVGVLVIPVLMANLGGIGQLLVCEAQVEQPFAVGAVEEGPQVTSSRTLSREQADLAFEGVDRAAELCGGVTAEIGAELVDTDTVRLIVTIVNGSELPWRGSIGLAADSAEIDVDLTTSLGDVPAGESRSDALLVRVREEQTDISGRVLLGP